MKASAAYSFPYDIQVSGAFSSIPGPGVRADYTVTSAIARSPIVGSTTGAATTVVNLVEPNSLFLDVQNRLDLRFGKSFRFNQTTIQGFADVFNVFNAGTVMSITNLRRRRGLERVVRAADDHGRPVRALRPAVEFLAGAFDASVLTDGRSKGLATKARNTKTSVWVS